MSMKYWNLSLGRKKMRPQYTPQVFCWTSLPGWSRVSLKSVSEDELITCTHELLFTFPFSRWLAPLSLKLPIQLLGSCLRHPLSHTPPLLTSVGKLGLHISQNHHLLLIPPAPPLFQDSLFFIWALTIGLWLVFGSAPCFLPLHPSDDCTSGLSKM